MNDNNNANITFSEHLLLKEKKHLDLYEVVALSNMMKIEQTNLYYAIQHIMITDLPEARLFYMQIILKNVKSLKRNDINVSNVDFYIDNFFISPLILNDSRFKLPCFLNLFFEIQANLAYLLYPKYLINIFDYQFSESIFNYSSEFIFRFLSSFNLIMSRTYSIIYRSLYEYEDDLYSQGSENTIISFLIQNIDFKITGSLMSEDNNFNDFPSAYIYSSIISWLNPENVINEILFSQLINILNQYKNYKLIDEGIKNIFRRLSHDNEKDYHEGYSHKSLKGIKTNIFEFFQKKHIFDQIYLYLTNTNDSEFARNFLWEIGQNIDIIKNNVISYELVIFIIKALKYAAHENNFYICSSIFQLICENNESHHDFYAININEIKNLLNFPPGNVEMILSVYFEIHLKLSQLFQQEVFSKEFIGLFISDSTKCNIMIRSINHYLSKHEKTDSLIEQILSLFSFIFDFTLQTPEFIEIYSNYFQIFSKIGPNSKLINDITFKIVHWLHNIEPPIELEIIQEIDHLFTNNKKKNSIIIGIKSSINDLITQLIKSNNFHFLKIAFKIINLTPYDKTELYPIAFEHLSQIDIDTISIDIRKAYFYLLSHYSLVPDNTTKTILTLLIKNMDDIANFKDKELISYIIGALTKIFQFDSFDYVYQFVLHNNEFEYIKSISKIPTNYSLTSYQNPNVFAYGDLILEFLNNTKLTSNQKNDSEVLSEQQREYLKILENATFYFIPLISQLPLNKITSIIYLIMPEIKTLSLSFKAIYFFFERITQLEPSFDEIKWRILDITKSYISEIKYSPNIIDFSKKIKQIIYFQSHMLSYDLSQTEQIFSQIPDGLTYLSTIHCQKADLDSQIHSYIDEYKKRYTLAYRSRL